MNNQNLKKWIIPNLPYILFVYLFDKAAQAVRLAPGADLSGKLLCIGNGFTSAFASPLPSFSPVDMLIGIAGAILIRLIVYTKGKNAKKYRKGVEYGSARWGNAEDIKPYIDPVFANNVLLTQTERLMMSSRPKQPKYSLAKKSCCNCDKGKCLLLDDGEECVCPQLISYSLLCKWFRTAVLPLDKELYAELLKAEDMRRCTVCGAAFASSSNHAKYCPDCRKRITRKQTAERMRKRRALITQ